MIALAALVEHLNEKIAQKNFPDFEGSYNGLQLETEAPIRGIAAAVDASFESIDKAIAKDCNFLLVHHGLFWKAPIPLTDHTFRKFSFLIQNQCAVYSSHLPLDAHETFGNNKQIVDLLSLKIIDRTFAYQGQPIGFVTEGIARDELLKRLELHLPPKHVWAFGPQQPKRIAILSGSGASVMDQLLEENIDTLITGELRQAHYAQAQEMGINVFLCGHYATEVFGVQALGKHLAHTFNLPFYFIPTECPL
jgi:dinuclear metal center YbgI/SA1388 family protein